MEMGADGARRAWAQLAGVARLDRLQVIVDAESPLARCGWIGILAIDGTVTASVPRHDLATPIATALRTLTSREATTPDVVRPHLPPMRQLLGPASLFSPTAGFSVGGVSGVEEVPRRDVQELFQAVSPDELDESGLEEVTGPLFASRAANGNLAAVCGYRCWPNDVAHLSVLTHPSHRRAGHATRVAAAAIQSAMNENLLPQWRARPLASQALAVRLGLVELGAQLGLEPA
jgi:hypothetical protein